MAKSRSQLEHIVQRKMDLQSPPTDMSMDALRSLVKSLEDVDMPDPGSRLGGTVSKRAKGGIANFKGHF